MNTTTSSFASRAETPLHEDELLGTTMLPSTGEGENMMKVFMEEHVIQILQPIAETVQDIQRSIKKLKDDAANANAIVDRSAEIIASHDQKFVLFSAGLARINDDMQHQRIEVSEALDRQVTMEGDIDLTKASLNKTEAYLQANTNVCHEIRKAVDDIDSRMRQMELSMSETNVNHMAFADRLSDLRNLHEGLNDRHMQMMTSMQQLRQSDENTRSVLKRSIATGDKQKKDAQRSFQLLDDRMKIVENMVLDTNHKTQAHEKAIKGFNSAMKEIVGDLGDVVGVQQGMNAKTDERSEPKAAAVAEKQASPAEKFGNRMGRIEENIAALHRSLGLEKDNMAGRHKELEDVVNKVLIEHRGISVCVDQVNKTHKSHEESIRSNDSRITLLDSNMDKTLNIADKNDSDVRSLMVNFRELGLVIDMEKHERDKTNTNLANNSRGLEATNQEMQNLSKDFIDMHGSMTKIGMRLELAHEYFQGMGKGLQDTHKRVTAGLDGMVPPKSVASRRMLPEIPGSKSTTASPSPPPRSQSPPL